MLNKAYMLNDDELNNVIGGMKTVVINSPNSSLISSPLLKLIWKLMKKQQKKANA